MIGEKLDEEFKCEIDKKVEDIHRSLESKTGNEFLNEKIREKETEAAIQLLHKDKAPGPDNIYGELLQEGSQALTRAINTLFNKSWSEKKVPQDWKLAKVKFLRKPGKPSYHNAGSYRPISLTSILGKCLERIVFTRLYSFVEHHRILDPEQEGFRRFHGTSMALLRLVQSIIQGFNDGHVTVGVFIDMEKAFDSVWRNGLLAKLHDMGITGKIWGWLQSFLESRQAFCNMKGSDNSKFCTMLGLPQGSVLSLLFNLFIKDIYALVEGKKVKFADDGTIWQTGPDAKLLVEALERDLVKITDWTKKWRMKLNIEKTEFCLFNRKMDNEISSITIKMDGKDVKRTDSPKLLGVILDEKLSFQKHIDAIERKATKAAASLAIVGRSEQISAENMLKLYKSIVLPHLEYGSTVWQIGNCEQLDKIQRKCLVLCLGTPATSGIEALEVEAGIMPLDLRREELAVRELVKIMAKDQNEEIAKCFDAWKYQMEESTEKFLSPFNKAFMQLTDVISNTGLDIRSVEPEASYLQSLAPSIQRPEYWNNLGSSKSRNKLQEEEARKIIEGQMRSAEKDVIYGFTDGFCRGNPGPCGAQACLFLPNEERVDLKQPVSTRSSILLGELIAIKIALESIKLEMEKLLVKKVMLFSDSQSAVGILTLGWENKSHTSVVFEIKQIMDILKRQNVEIDINWTPGHAEITGNEIADRLAKEAAIDVENMPEVCTPLTSIDIKRAVKDSCTVKWQNRWEASQAGRHMYDLHPTVKAKKKAANSIPSQRITSQLRTGYCYLNGYMHTVGLKDSPLCTCGEPKSVKHYIEDCEQHVEIRERLMSKMFFTIDSSDWSCKMNLEVKAEDDLQECREILNEIFEEYILSTKRFKTQYFFF